jgi:hypothetical protein
MMPACPTFATAIAVSLLAAMASPADAAPRDVLTVCQAIVDRAAQAASVPRAQGDRSDQDPELQRCRQVIRDWTLRESRMSVDENGRPLR